MQLLQFTIDHQMIADGQCKLSDNMRQAIYSEHADLFDRLDYGNDTTFLEPSLFCYFMSEVDQKRKISLDQSLFGYFREKTTGYTITGKADEFGLVNLPNLGYVRTIPTVEVDVDVAHLMGSLVPNDNLPNSSIRLCIHPTDHLRLKSGIVFQEPPEVTVEKNKANLHAATVFFHSNLPEFWSLIKSVTREVVLFDSPNQNSFAAISHHGTAYLNVDNKLPSAVFFLDDLAHQCGHIIFNALTLEHHLFIKQSKQTSLEEVYPQSRDSRKIYGTFHGLFTYTCILLSLDKFLEHNRHPALRHEALGRLGFYLRKFRSDLELMNSDEILTKAGMLYHQQFCDSFESIANKYRGDVQSLNYSNQPYVFQPALFEKLNPLTY